MPRPSHPPHVKKESRGNFIYLERDLLAVNNMNLQSFAPVGFIVFGQ
jgi:hypothetical protein